VIDNDTRTYLTRVEEVLRPHEGDTSEGCCFRIARQVANEERLRGTHAKVV